MTKRRIRRRRTEPTRAERMRLELPSRLTAADRALWERFSWWWEGRGNPMHRPAAFWAFEPDVPDELRSLEAFQAAAGPEVAAEVEERATQETLADSPHATRIAWRGELRDARVAWIEEVRDE